MDKTKTLMVGVATEQNAINITPAIQHSLGVSELLYIITDRAKEQKWAEGSYNVLMARGV